MCLEIENSLKVCNTVMNYACFKQTYGNLSYQEVIVVAVVLVISDKITELYLGSVKDIQFSLFYLILRKKVQSIYCKFRIKVGYSWKYDYSWYRCLDRYCE